LSYRNEIFLRWQCILLSVIITSQGVNSVFLGYGFEMPYYRLNRLGGFCRLCQIARISKSLYRFKAFQKLVARTILGSEGVQKGNKPVHRRTIDYHIGLALASSVLLRGLWHVGGGGG
jgi:hypothetical protein